MTYESNDDELWRTAELPPRHLDEPPPDLQATVLTETSRVVRRRRHLRRTWLVAALALVYAGGVWSGRVLDGGSTPSPSPEESLAVVEEGPSSREGLEIDLRLAAQTDDPHELELLASIESRARRVELLIRAGDLYLERDGDISGALRCYRELLKLHPQRTAAKESWLLTALRQDRF